MGDELQHPAHALFGVPAHTRDLLESMRHLLLIRKRKGGAAPDNELVRRDASSAMQPKLFEDSLKHGGGQARARLARGPAHGLFSYRFEASFALPAAAILTLS